MSKPNKGISRFFGRLMVNSKAQWTFLLYVLAMVLLVLAIVALLIYSPISPVFRGEGEFNPVMTAIFVGALLLAWVLSVLVGFFVSNMMFGPLKRLNDHMRRVARGETSSEIYFRKGDYFSELAEAFNMVLARIKKEQGVSANEPASGSDKKGPS